MRYIGDIGNLGKLLEKCKENPMGMLYQETIKTNDGKIMVECLSKKSENEIDKLVEDLRGKYENDIADLVEEFSDPASNIYLVNDERGLIGGFAVVLSDASGEVGDWLVPVAKGNRGKVASFTRGVVEYLDRVSRMYAEYNAAVVFSIGNWARRDERKYSAIEFCVQSVIKNLKEKYTIEEANGGYEIYMNMDRHTKNDAWDTTTVVTGCVMDLVSGGDDLSIRAMSVGYKELGLNPSVRPSELVKTPEGRETLENALKEYLKRTLGDGFDFE